MIFVAAGTQDAREIVAQLLAAGEQVIASVVSSYGKALLADEQNLLINEQPLDGPALAAYLAKHKVRAFVDASHPYAVNVSKNAMAACANLSIPYIRYEREISPRPEGSKIYLAADYAEAADKAASLGRTIFLTTGSRNLAVLRACPALSGCRLIARVLPETEVINECRQLGFQPKDIVAMQGPFSKELNKELYKKYEAEVILTKNSGAIGGTDTKLEAAQEMGLPVVMIDRPRIEYPRLTADYAEIVAFAKEYGRE